MDLLFNYENVYWDTKSNYDKKTINELQYLEKLFLNLKRLLATDFVEFDFYILFSHDSTVTPDSFYIERKNKVLFWFSDESGTFPAHLTENYNLIFKSYVKKEYLNVFSNPLGYVNEFENYYNLISDQKNIDVFFSGCLNDNRVRLYKLLFLRKFKSLFFLKILPYQIFKIIFEFFEIKDLGENKNVFLFSSKFKSGLNYKSYYEFLLQSKFILCPKGFDSTETFRHIETLHSGGIVISEKMPDTSIYADNPFITYDNLDELNDILNKVAHHHYDEKELISKHQLFYKNKLEINVVALRISELCKACKK
jgi:hypothetical protein